jgi:ATP-dependent DNA ligase
MQVSVGNSQGKAGFVQPMLLLRTDRLPEGPEWLYELKLDGYRAIAAKTDDRVHLRSRNKKRFCRKISERKSSHETSGSDSGGW